MRVFKWNVVKAGHHFFVRKRSFWQLYLGFVYSGRISLYYWMSAGHVLEYCAFSTYSDAAERCEKLNIVG